VWPEALFLECITASSNFAPTMTMSSSPLETSTAGSATEASRIRGSSLFLMQHANHASKTEPLACQYLATAA